MSDIYPLTLLYDGDCAICRFEIAWLKRRDHRDRLRFADIAAADFDARRWGRRNGFARFPSAEELDQRIHALTASREIVAGIDVFRLAWRAVGLGLLAEPLGWRVLRPFAERGYLAFARHRHGLSRRFDRLFRAVMPRDDDCAAGACRTYRRGE